MVHSACNVTDTSDTFMTNIFIDHYFLIKMKEHYSESLVMVSSSDSILLLCPASFFFFFLFTEHIQYISHVSSIQLFSEAWI